MDNQRVVICHLQAEASDLTRVGLKGMLPPLPSFRTFLSIHMWIGIHTWKVHDIWRAQGKVYHVTQGTISFQLHQPISPGQSGRLCYGLCWLQNFDRWCLEREPSLPLLQPSGLICLQRWSWPPLLWPFRRMWRFDACSWYGNQRVTH